MESWKFGISESILKSAESHQPSSEDKFQYGPLTERLIAVSL